MANTTPHFMEGFGVILNIGLSPTGLAMEKRPFA